MFEGTSVQFVVDADEVREELKAAQLNWPIVKILGQEDEEEKDPCSYRELPWSSDQCRHI